MKATLSPQPKTVGEDSCFRKRLPGREAQDVLHDAIDLFVNGRVLSVGADFFLGRSPEMIHRIEFRGSFGKPEEFDAQVVGQSLGARRRMTGIFVQKKSGPPAPIMPVNHPQELLEVRGALVLLLQEQSMTGIQIDRAEENPLCIEAGNGDGSLLSPKRPSGLEWRKQQNIGFVLGQDDLPGIQPLGSQELDAAPDAAFFSLGPDRGSAHIADVSRRSPGGGVLGAPSTRTRALRFLGSGSGLREKPSSSRIDSRVPADSTPALLEEGLRVPGSTATGVRKEADPTALAHRRTLGTSPSSGRSKPGLLRAGGPGGSRVRRHRLREAQTFAEKPDHRGLL